MRTPHEYALAGLPRALAQLTDGDQKTVMEFAEYLSLRRAAEKEQEDSAEQDSQR